MKTIYSFGAAVALTISAALPLSVSATPQIGKSSPPAHEKWEQQHSKTDVKKKATKSIPQANKKLIASVQERIVFSDFSDENQGLFLINPDGSDPIKIVEGWADYGTITPDGSKIIFLGYNGDSGDIYSVNVDGTSLTQITHTSDEEDGPHISPDGKKIVFSIHDIEHGNSEIFVMNVDGSGVEKLTSTVNEYKFSPSFSPDGKKIIYNVSDNNTYANDVYIMDYDGKNHKNITNTPDLSEDFPKWSPDGSLISFRVDQNVFTIKPDGSTRAQATQFTGDGYVINPVWSPDGKRFALTYDDGNFDSILYLNTVPIGGSEKDFSPLAKDGYKYATDWEFVK